MTINQDLLGAIAATRLGLGAKPGELAAARGDPRGYLLSQIRDGGAEQPQPGAPGTAERLVRFRDFQQLRAEAKQAGQTPAGPTMDALKALHAAAEADVLARAALAATTDAGFRERWALFWGNHFTVAAGKTITTILAGPFETEAIRPHVFGRFEDLLVASSSHPGMLLYLDQAQSIGPTSLAGQRQQGRGGKNAGLNENLAREILELHTVGLSAGYSQADVTEFARALTGWSVGGPRGGDERDGRFVFHEEAHQPGARTIMGRTYAEGGQAQARAVMRDLSVSPATARHLAGKLARHFVSDDPPQALVDRLAQTYLKSDGHLGAVAQALIGSEETWSPDPVKFKTPYEFLVSSWRAVGSTPTSFAQINPVLIAMGQKTFAAPSPKGWPEESGAWCAPDAIIKRMDWSSSFATATIGDHNPVDLARAALGARLSPLAAQTIARAETRAEGLAILLMTPEFQRR
jgi:uncharacterized protein (DUF1800 family)